MIDPADLAAAEAQKKKEEEEAHNAKLKVFEFLPNGIGGDGVLTINTPNGPEDHPAHFRYIAQGGFGAVYSATLHDGDPLKTKRPLVVKIAMGTGADGLHERELREKSILKEVNIVDPKCGAAVMDRDGSLKLQIPNAREIQVNCAISDHFGNTLGRYIYEELRGSPADGWQDDRQAKQAAEMLVQLSTQLIDSGKIHGDIKPANIFANKDPLTGRPISKVGDWGSCVPNDGSFIVREGTPEFAGPELIGVTTARSDKSKYMVDSSERNMRTDRRDTYSLMASLSELANSKDFHQLSPERQVLKNIIKEAIDSLPKDLDAERKKYCDSAASSLSALLSSTEPSFREYENVHDPELRNAWQAVHAAATDPDITRRSSMEDLRVHSLLLIDRADMPRIYTAQQINDMGAHLAASLGDKNSQHLAPLNIAASFALLTDPRLDPKLAQDIEKLSNHTLLNNPPPMSDFVKQERIQSRIYAQKAHDFCIKQLHQFSNSINRTKAQHVLDKSTGTPNAPPNAPKPPNHKDGYVTPIPPKKPDGPTR